MPVTFFFHTEMTQWFGQPAEDVYEGELVRASNLKDMLLKGELRCKECDSVLEVKHLEVCPHSNDESLFDRPVGNERRCLICGHKQKAKQKWVDEKEDVDD